MPTVLDTNILIRVITVDDPIRAKKAKQLIETEPELFVPEAVFPEIEYFLKKIERRTHAEISRVFVALTGYGNIVFTKETSIAIEIYKNYNLDMADCLIAAHSLKGRLASFDEKLLTVEGINSYWKK